MAIVVEGKGQARASQGQAEAQGMASPPRPVGSWTIEDVPRRGPGRVADPKRLLDGLEDAFLFALRPDAPAIQSTTTDWVHTGPGAPSFALRFRLTDGSAFEITVRSVAGPAAEIPEKTWPTYG